ncbi:MAG: FAD/NAD(P)-binding protein [Methylomicrobium sp.]|nr:FAD/NAD(P)-binding protein [Methylomicrobium sp.]
MKTKIVIIGGGLSGTLIAMRLASQSNGPTVILIEKRPELLGRGIAYQNDFTHQPLNVVAAGMSIFEDKPMDFVDWLNSNRFKYKHLIKTNSPQAFVPRKIFGDYIVEQLENVQQSSAGRLRIRIDEATSILDEGNRKHVVLASGLKLQADHVVFALGNFPPSDIFPNHSLLQSDSRYHGSPWSDTIYRDLVGDENLLLVGAGLSAVDVLLGLNLRNFAGKVTVISRRGRFPLSHDLSHASIPLALPENKHPRSLFLWIRTFIRNNGNVPWPAIIDGLRPLTKKVWLHWSIDEKRYFLKRIRPFWEIVRHRIPAESQSLLQSLIDSDLLEIKEGYIIDGRPTDNGIEVDFYAENKRSRKTFQKVINCTGPESNYRKVRFPVIRELIERGTMMTDELGLGIKCTPEGRIINAHGNLEEGLWCIGPMRKSVLWESTALREIREQATELSKLLRISRLITS